MPFKSDLKSDLEGALKSYFRIDFKTEFLHQKSVTLVANEMYVTIVVGR